MADNQAVVQAGFKLIWRGLLLTQSVLNTFYRVAAYINGATHQGALLAISQHGFEQVFRRLIAQLDLLHEAAAKVGQRLTRQAATQRFVATVQSATLLS